MKPLPALALALTLAVTGAAAQVAPDESKPSAKVAPPAKSADAKKATPPKKAAQKKPRPAKAQAPKKAADPVATGNPNVRIYKAGDPGAPTLRDKEGKVIPTNPDAYDVSSATKK